MFELTILEIFILRLLGFSLNFNTFGFTLNSFKSLDSSYVRLVLIKLFMVLSLDSFLTIFLDLNEFVFNNIKLDSSDWRGDRFDFVGDKSCIMSLLGMFVTVWLY